MKRFLPCLSYPLNEIDLGQDERVDEGESRLCGLRPILCVAAKTMALQKFLEPEHRSSLPALLSPGAAGNDQWSVAERSNILDSLLKSDHAKKPCIAILRTTVRLLCSRDVDALDQVTMLACVPVRRSNHVAMPSSPPVRETPVSILVTWPKSTFAIAKGATHSATLRVDRLDKQRVKFTIKAADGTKHENLIATDVPAALLDALFARGPRPEHPVVSLETLATSPRLPSSPGELPEQLQLQLAGFLQIRLRAHVLTAAAGPLDTSRPLWFEDFKLTWTPVGGGLKPGMTIKGYLHPCSAACFCGAHALPDVTKRWPGAKFTGRQTAAVTIRMCGARLVEGLGCPTHGTSCDKNQSFAPGVCCSNVGVHFACCHECKPSQPGVPSSDTPKGVLIPCGDLPPWSWKELTLLLALCTEFDLKARPFFNTDAPKDARRKLIQLTVGVTRELDRRVELFDFDRIRRDCGPTDADLAQLDVVALASLRQGGLVQVKLTPTRNTTPRLAFSDHSRNPGVKEKKLFIPQYHWLFPRHDAPHGKRVLGGTALYGLGGGGSSGESADTTSTIDAPDAKRQCTEDTRYNHEEITEYYDVEGLRSLSRQLHAILANADLPERQQRRGLHFAQFLNALDQEMGDEVDGPLGLPCRKLVCKYRARNDGGRLYPTGMAKICGVSDGEARTVCTQSAPRETRPFFCCRFAHDYDMKNAQPQIMIQMSARLTWADDRAIQPMPQLQEWCTNRPGFIEHVAEVHCLARDEERFVEYRKDTVKELVISLLFGGTYDRWIRNLCEDEGRKRNSEPRSPRLERLAEELTQLRKDVFESKQWVTFVEKDRDRLRKEGEKEDDAAIDRSVMARIAQKTENTVLDAMRAYLKENGWTVLTLCFDGLHVSLRPVYSLCDSLLTDTHSNLCGKKVQHRPQRTLDIAAMQRRITRDTKYVIEIVEKPLFNATEFPVLSLARA